MLKIGSHVSFSKGGLLGCVKEIMNFGGNTFMFYTGAPQNTVRKEIDKSKVIEAHQMMKDNNINPDDVICHAPYIINLATSKKEQWEFSINFLKQEINRCEILGIKKIVIHPGNAVGITRSEGLLNIINALKQLVNENVLLLIETMAGKGTELCSTLEELQYVIESVDSSYLGVCLDTCHLNDSGVDINKFDAYLNEFDKQIGIHKIKCIHINDSKNEIGMKKDRHENFGFGKIGFDNLINVVYNDLLKDVPKILETPFIPDDKNSYPPYKEEIKMIKNKLFNDNLIDDVITYFKK